MTLLKDLIEIPEHVGKGDFVFTLENAVDHPEEVLRDYVVTEQLQECFDEALSEIRSSVVSRESRASYLHGSFGSGKSHFMAVLYLLLAQVAEARDVPALQPPLDKHDQWLEGKKFLLVPVHMINSGASTLEEAVFAAYIERVEALHNEAPTPAVFASGPLLADALGLRDTMGDDTFFEALNETSGGEPAGLGKLATSAWNAESFEIASEAKPGARESDALVGALVKAFFPSYAEVAGENKYVPFNDGLDAISRHAKDLGYDGLVLFLDELILWLATRIADMAFVQREGQKLTALREAPIEARPVPITSFVARQRDLRELIGDHYPGAEHLSFHDGLSWQDGRFSTITLEDRNLRAIAEKRVLKPKNEAAKTEIDAAFANTMKAGGNVLDVLLGKKSSPEEFRAVYPFSPAFIDTLVAASSALQRERTAIRVMIQLLSERRDDFELGDVMPVGDLFDALSGAAEPFSPELKRQFQDAQRLYATRLRPQIAAAAGVEAESTFTGPAAAEDRLIKTLLLAALIPDAESLRGLTASRLVALNHGTIATPIPGQETSTALASLSRLRGSVGQLKIQEGASDPTVQLELSGIDTERIVESAKGELDNSGARRRLIRDFLSEALGIAGADKLFAEHKLEWRGIPREVEIALENVRELSADKAFASGSGWKLVVDFPFDTEGSGRRDDEARIEELKEKIERSRTAFWLPAFVTRAVQRDIGLLVTIEGLLAGERLNNHAAHLSNADREKARQLLESQRSQLRSTVWAALNQAYGVATPKPEAIEGQEKPVFESLEPTLDLRPPVGSDLTQAVAGLCDQFFRNQFPDHPEFGERITPAKLGKVWALVQRAAEREGGRLDDLEKADRVLLKSIAEPLELGEMHEGPFTLSTEWRTRFVKAKASAKIDTPTVGDLRQWIDEPSPRGLTRELQHLVVLAYAAQSNLSFVLHNAPYPISSPSDLKDDLVLHEVVLPPQDEWDMAAKCAGAIFGVAVPPLATAQNLDNYGKQVRAAAASRVDSIGKLLAAVEGTLTPTLGLSHDTKRIRNIREAKKLVDDLAAGSEAQALPLLASLDIESTPEELSRTLAHSQATGDAIRELNWDIISKARELSSEGDARAGDALDQLTDAAAATEMVAELSAALEAAERACTAVVVSQQPVVQAPQPARGETHTAVSLGEAREILAAVPDADGTEIDLTIRTTQESSSV